MSGELLDALARGLRPRARRLRRHAHERAPPQRASASWRPAAVELVGAAGLVERLRAVKDEQEIAAIAAAAALTDEIYEWLFERGLGGRTERERGGRARARDAPARRERPELPLDRRRAARTARCRTPSRATSRSSAGRS